jgi:hypothetical protein
MNLVTLCSTTYKLNGTVPRWTSRRSQTPLIGVRSARPPLWFRVEVPLPIVGDRPERRAWDAMIYGGGARTAIGLDDVTSSSDATIRRITFCFC